MVICDCTSLTQAGYVGDDIETVIQRLVQVGETLEHACVCVCACVRAWWRRRRGTGMRVCYGGGGAKCGLICTMHIAYKVPL